MNKRQLRRRTLRGRSFKTRDADRKLHHETLERRELLAAEVMESSFAPGTTQAEIDDYYQQRALDTSSQSQQQGNVGTGNARWRSTQSGAGPNLGDSSIVTWSIVPDNTGVAGLAAGETSDLIAFMDGIYGNGNATATDPVAARPWFGLFQRTFDAWEDVSGIDFVYEANDDALAQGGGAVGIPGVRGDIRIGGGDGSANPGVLAFAYLPTNGGNSGIDGDVVIDTSHAFYSNNADGPTGLNVGFHNTVVHEIGHSIGLTHVIPDTGNYLMEPTISTSFRGPQLDDIIGAHSLYGDRFGDNDTIDKATPIGALSDVTVVVDGVSIDDNSDVDWYSFTATAGQSFGMVVRPQGEVYDVGPQNGTVSTVNSREFSDLRFEVYDKFDNLIANQDSQAIGLTEATATLQLAEAGTYTVAVFGASTIGPATGVVTPTQLYSLELTEEVITGPQLVAIRPDAEGLLTEGDKLNVAPREFNLLFKGGANIDESTISPDTVKLVRSGGDGIFGNGNDVEVALGYVGLNNPGSTNAADLSQIVMRPASSASFNSKNDANQFPDDFYQIQIIGAGATTLQNSLSESFNNGQDFVANFQLDRGAQVVSVVSQPVTRDSSNVLSQDRKVIEVYFDNQELRKADAENVAFYRLFDAAAQTPAANPTPATVVYDEVNNQATLTFASDIPEGTYRLDIGQAVDNSTMVDDRGDLGLNDASISFDTAAILGPFSVAGAADKTIRVSGSIEPQRIVSLPPLPGGLDDPGHREIQREQHIASSGTTATLPSAIATIQYHFPLVLGEFDSGDPLNPGEYLNLITETEKQIVRDIFEVYAKESGLEFIEGAAGGGLSIGKGDLRALSPGIGPNAGVAGLGGPGNVVINASLYTQSNRFYGDGFTGVMYHEIGHALSLSHAYDQPAVQGVGPLPPEVLPGPNDLLHLRRISPPNSTDIDVYEFSLPSAGRLSAEVFAERLTLAANGKAPSLLNSALALYKIDATTGVRTLVARNDQYFGADAFLDIELSAGAYVIGVSSTGNTNYDLNVPNSGFGGTTDGLYELSLNFKPTAVSQIRDTFGTALDGDADGTPGGVYQFWFQSADPANTFIVDKLADTLEATGQGAGTLASPFESISQGLTAAGARLGTSISSPTIVRIVGNGGLDDDLGTIADNRPYLVGTAIGGAALPDGAEFRVPAGVNVVIEGGTLIKMRKANIDAGSTGAGINRTGGSIQVFGTPTDSVFLRSYHDDTAGRNSDGGITTPKAGDFGGIVFRDDSDREANGIFLNYVNHADIKHGGGKVFVDSNELTFTSIHVTNARPTLSFNLIAESATAAISASPDSFDDSQRRIGPDVHGNYLVSNSINGLAVRIDTISGAGLTKLRVSGRFDDADITHVFSENLIIAGGSGGPVRDAVGTLIARPAGRLQIDPGVVVKLNRARIEMERGDATLIAEGTVNRPVVFTAQDDKRYGGSGSFDTNSSPASVPQPGAWGGLFFGEGSSGSIDQSIITFGGGNAGIEGSDFPFNAVEIHQADVRIANSLLQDNAATASVGGNRRNGRGSNGVSTIYVRGAQPVLVNNVIKNNIGTPISINANSLEANIQRDYGRSTGRVDRFNLFDDNYGPLIRLNRLENNGSVGGGVNGVLVRGEEVTVESVWDDTDIVHVLQSEVIVDNLHHLGGLTLQSSNSESLVIKLSGPNAGFTATGTPVEIEDRIGGTIHVLGTVGHPVILTSLDDDSVGAGFTKSGLVNRNTNNSGAPTTGDPGDWRGLLFDEFSNDRNVSIVRELENPLTNKQNVNGTATLAQILGTLAPNIATAANPQPNQKAGDDNSRLGFEIHGFISPDDGSDTDVYSFTGYNGTPIWIDVDRTDSTLDVVVELIDATTGATIVSSSAPNQFGGPNASDAETLTQNTLRGGDYYSQNYRDAGFYYVLSQPGAAVGSKGTFFIRVRSNTATAGNAQSRGKYQLQIRTQQVDEFPGSTVRFSDIRYAATGIDVRGLPAHSPLIGEAGEALAGNGTDINDSFGTAANLVNLLETDVATLGISGALRDDTDVDWYSFDLNQAGIQVIGGVNDAAGTVAVVLDVDYADGAVSGDTTIAVYDDNQRLIYIGRESDVEDDQRPDGVLSINDLTRGSLAKKDGFIGPIHLSPGLGSQKYYVAVMSNRQQPSALNGIFQSNVNDATAQTRLEPVNSVRRIVEDHLGSIGYTSNGVPVLPESGALFDISNPTSDIQAISLRDVGLYVATDVVGNSGQAGLNDSLYTFNPYTGGTYVTRVSTNIATGGSGFDDVQDIVVRSDGRMFGYQRQVPNQPLNQPNFSIPDRVGQLVEIDPGSGQVIAGSATNDNIAGPVIGTAGLTVPNTRDLADNVGSHAVRAEEFTLSDEVDAFTFERKGQTGPASAPLPVYDTYFSVRESDITSRLYRGNQDGNAAPGAGGASPNYGVIGDIQPAGVTFATQNLTAIRPVPMSPPDITSIRIKSRDAGTVGNFRLEFANRPNNLNMVVNTSTPFDTTTGVRSRVITLTIGGVLDTNGAVTNAPSAAAITHAINSHSVAKTWVTAIIDGGNDNAPFRDGNDGTPAIIFTPSVTTPVVGSDGPDVYGPLRGRVTGLSFGGYDNAGNHTGPLYGVTTAGELITINQNTGEVTNILESGDTFGVSDLEFQGLTLGPQNVEGGRYRNTLFAVTGDGQVVAFDTTTQLNDPIFDTNVVTQTITVAGGTPNIGYFTITSDAGTGVDPRPRFTTVPIAHDAPATLTINETQTIDTTGYASVTAGLQSTFTLSLVDDQGAITSLSASNTNANNPVTVIGAADTAIPVESTAGLPATPFVIQVDNEQMRVNSVSGSVLTVTRGWNGTAVVSHDDTATVFEYVNTELANAATVPVAGSTLSSAIDDQAASNTFTVADATPFSVNDVIRIGNEEMIVTGVNLLGGQLTVTRGVGSTKVAHHNVTSIAPALTPTAVTIVSDTLTVQDAIPLSLANRLRIDGEDMRVLSVNTGTNTVLVVRGVNGTTPATHAVGNTTFKLDTTTAIDVNATLTVVQSRLEALPSVGAGNVVVTGGQLSGDALDTDAVLTTADLTKNPETIVFQGALKGKDLQPLTTDTTGLVGDEIQTISLDTSINHGVFRLDFRTNLGVVETTADLSFDATASLVQAALESLPSIGVGNVIVTGNVLPGGPLRIQFVNELQDQDVNQLVVDRGLLSDHEFHTITLAGAPVSGDYQLTINDPVNGIFGTSNAIAFDATAAEVRTALTNGIAALNNNNVVVTGGPSPTTPFSVQFIGNLAGAHVAPFRIDEDSNTLAPITDNTVELDIRAVAPNTIQKLELSNSTSFGQFRLTLTDPNVLTGTGTTGNIQYNATAAQVRNALQANNAFPQLAGNLSVTGGPLHAAPVFIEFINEMAGLQIAQIQVVGTPVFAPAATLTASTTQTAIVSPQNEIQAIEIPGTPLFGSFRLTLDDTTNGFNNAKSDTIPFDADAATVQAALISGIPALAPGGISNIFVEGGPLNVAPIRVEFVRGLSRVEIAEFTVEAVDNLMLPVTENAVLVSEDQASANPLAVNEIQQIVLTGPNSTAGQFTLSLEVRSEEAGFENMRIIKTSDPINYNDGPVAVVQKIVAGIPELAGQIAPGGGPLSQMNVNVAPITLEFINDYAGFNIDLLTINVVTGFAPNGADVDISTPQNNVPQTPTIGTTRDGIGVLAPVTPEIDGVLSVFDALDALPNFDVNNIRVAGDLQNPGATVSFIGPLATVSVNDFNINNFLMTNVPPFVSDTPAPYNNTNTTLAFLSNTSIIDDGLADSPIMTIDGYEAGPNQGNQRPIGLAFSPFDFNLWHPTTRRGNDAGHGINAADDNSRTPGSPDVNVATDGVNIDRTFKESAGGVSLYFGFEPWLQNEVLGSNSYLTYTSGINAQLGIRETSIHQDLSSNPNIVTGVGQNGTGSYNLPGGAFGSIKSKSFDLTGSEATDRPTLYFSYFLETESHAGSTVNSDGNDPFRDSARVWASRDGKVSSDPTKVWELLATNNSTLSNPNTGNVAGSSELAGFLSHLSDAGLNSSAPRDTSQQLRQELFDNSDQWRQARVDLSTYAGEADVQLRFDFSTSGALGDPTLNNPALGNIDGNFGEVSSDSRSIRSLANNFEGFYIDDIIVGYAERGEMVTGAGGNAGVTDLDGSDRTRNSDPAKGAEILSGPYQVEIRRTGEYEFLDPATGNVSVGITFDTNDRHIIELSEVARVDFESAVFPSNSPIDMTQLAALIPTVDLPPLVPTFTRTTTNPHTGTWSVEAGGPVTAYQVTTAQLGGSGVSGVVEFTFSVASSTDTSIDDGLYFLIDGVPQALVAAEPDFPGASNTRLAKGQLNYRTVRFNLPSGPHTFTWLYDGRVAGGAAFVDNVVLLEGGTGLLADRNREREQGQFVIESNFISDSLNRGINVEPGTPQGTLGGVSHQGSLINFPQTNADRLIPGIVITNNVVVGSGTGIRFAGETTSNPQRPVPFGRIVNNTLSGVSRSGTGVQIVGIASPTLLNNLFTDLNTSIANNSTAAANGSDSPIIRSNFFQSNNNNPALGTAFIDAGNTGSPFIDAANRNYYLVPGSTAVDSGQDNEQDRADYKTFKIELGIPESAIIAPDRDVYGQLRVDGSGSPTGGGASVFIDRGAVDRSDGDAPFAVILNPIDDDDADRDPNVTIVHQTSSLLENFQILLGDGRGPNSPFEGTGVNGLTVDDPNDPAIARRAVQILQNGEPLEQGIDYTLGYNELTGVLLLTPLSTLWEQTSVYKITLDNTLIADRAGNLLRPNQVDGSTEFVVIVPEIDIDFGDAPASYGTLLIDGGARHAAINRATPRLGGFLDGEADSAGVGTDDIPSVLVIDGNIQDVGSGPFTIAVAGSGHTVQLDSVPSVGDNLSVSSEGRTVVFEFVELGMTASAGRVAVVFDPTESPAEIVAALTSVMQNTFASVNVQALAEQTNVASPIVSLVGVDDEDGAAIGSVSFVDVNTSNNVVIDGLFLEPSTGEVLSYLNPKAAGGAELVISTIGGGFLDAWVDFNGDGDFLDLGERVLTGHLVGNGDDNRVSILTPVAPGVLSGGTGVTWARFRLSPDGSPAHDGLVVGGEVEDYRVFIAEADLPEPAASTVFDRTDGLFEDSQTLVVPTGSFSDTLNGAMNLQYELQTDVGNGTLTFNADGSFEYDPNAEFYGTDSFTYFISGTQRTNVNGALIDLPVRSSQLGIVTLVVEPENDAPTAEDKVRQTTEPSSTNPATPVVFTAAELLEGAQTHPDPDSTVPPYDESEQTLSVTQISVFGADGLLAVVPDETPQATFVSDGAGGFVQSGTVVVDFENNIVVSVTYTPAADYNEFNPPSTQAPLAASVDRFVYTVSDDGKTSLPNGTLVQPQPAAESVDATVAISVRPQNDTPTAINDFINDVTIGAAREEQLYVIDPNYLLVNDYAGRSVDDDESLGLAAFAGTGASYNRVDERVAIGPLNQGIAVSDSATGTGFVMFSVQDVFARFAADPPADLVGSANSDHLVAVRYSGTAWEYNNDTTWVEFTPATGDRLIASLDFDNDTIDAITPQGTPLQGIEQGVDLSDLTFAANQFDGGVDAGEFTVGGTFFELWSPATTPNDGPVSLVTDYTSTEIFSIAPINAGVAVHDSATGFGFIMFSGESVFDRFIASPPRSAPDSLNSEHLVAVRFNGIDWQYSNDVQWVTFTPVPTDEFRLIASVNFSSDTIVPLRFDRVPIQGIERGFVKGDLVFEADRFKNLDDDGEFTVSGTTFEVPDDPGFPVGFDAYPLTTAAGGTVNYNSATGMLEYTSAEDYYGPDSFVYWIADQGINVDAEGRVTDLPKYTSATVSLYVNPDNDAPAATTKTFDVLESVGGADSTLLITSNDLVAGSVGDADPAFNLIFPNTSPLNERIQDGNNNVVSLIVGSTTIDKDNVDISARYYTTADQSRGYLTGVEFENGFLKQLFYVSDGDFNGDNPRSTANPQQRSFDTFDYVIQDNAEYEVIAPDGTLTGTTAIELDQFGDPNVKQAAPATVRIRVFPQNDPPKLEPDTIATDDTVWETFSSVDPTEGQGAFTIDKDFLFNNDNNSPDTALDERSGINDGPVLTISGVGNFSGAGTPVKLSTATTELGGTIELLTSGDLRYTPAPFAFGRDRFTYFATDQGIDEATDGTRTPSNPPRESFQTVSIFLDPVNQRPASQDRLFQGANLVEGPASLTGVNRPGYSFTAIELLSGPPPATKSDAPLTTPVAFLEDEQTLSIVRVSTGGASFDVDNLQDRQQLDGSGNGQVTLPTGVYGSEFDFDFVDFKLTDATYRPGPSYNQRPPFSSPESFTYVLRDDGKTTLPGTPAMPTTPTLVNLAPQRSVPVRAQFVILPVNEPVTIGSFQNPVDVLEQKSIREVSIPFAIDVFPGALTSLDELEEQVVLFNYRDDLSSVPAGLFRLDPVISVDRGTGRATLKVNPIPFAVSAGPLTIVMEYQDSIPGDATFVPETDLLTFTLSLRPVNDPPQIDLSGAGTLQGSNPSNPNDEAYSVATDGTITLTLKEDITGAGGVAGSYEIPYRRDPILSSFQPVGLLDVFNVGPTNEVDGTPGGSQTLSLGSFTAQTSQGGSLTATVNAGGDQVLLYTPPTDYNNTLGLDDTFTYTVVDSNTGGQTFNPVTGQLEADPLTSISNTVVIDLQPVNDQPLFEVSTNEIRTAERKPGNAATPPLAGYAFNILSGPATATDENDFSSGQTRVFDVDMISSDPAGTVSDFFDVLPTVNPITGVLTYQPKDYVFGTFVFDVSLVAGIDNPARGDISTSIVQQLTINVRPVNDAPVYAPGAGNTLNFTVLEDPDSDPANNELLRIPASGASASGDLLGVFVVGPQPQFEGGTTTPGGNQTVSISSVPTTTGQGGTLVLSTDGSGDYLYTPPANFVGTDTFTYEVIDDGVNVPVNSNGQPVAAPMIGVGTVTITVAGRNDAPVLTGDLNVLVGEDAGAQIIQNWATLVLPGPADATDEINGTSTLPAQQIVTPIQIIKINDADPSDDNILVSDPVVGAVPKVELVGNSLTLTFETLPGASGAARYELILRDNGPNDPNNGDVNESRFQFNIVVSDDNDPPTFDFTDASGIVTVDEFDANSPAYSAVWATNISAGLNEDSEQMVTSFELTFPANKSFLFAVPPAIDPSTGVLTFTGAADVSGTVNVTVVAIDSSAGRSDMPDASGQSPAPQVLQIVITPTDDDPVAVDDEIDTDEDNILRIKLKDLLENDFDIDSAFDPNEVISVLMDLPATSDRGATLSFDPATGDILYNPNTSSILQALSPSETLPDQFVYKITDANGIQTNPGPSALVKLTVQGLNDRPVVNPDSASVTPSGTVTIDVLANDTDPDGTIDRTSVLVTRQPTNGSVRLTANGNLVYTAQAGFSGTDVIRYTVADDLGQPSEEATVTIGVGNLPTANPDIGGAFAGDGAIDIDVLSNDTGDLNLASLQIETQPNNGTVAILANGMLRYTPTAPFTGEDTFSYSIADTAGRRSTPGDVTVRYVQSGRQNPVKFSDVNADGDNTPDDALRVINKLAEDGRDANGIVLTNGIPIPSGDRGPDFWDADGSQFVTPNDILFVLNQLAEDAVNDRGLELIQPSGELIGSDMIEIGTNLNRNGDRFEPVVSTTHSTDKVVTESVLEAQLDLDLIDLIVDDEATKVEDVATIDDVLTSLF